MSVYDILRWLRVSCNMTLVVQNVDKILAVGMADLVKTLTKYYQNTAKRTPRVVTHHTTQRLSLIMYVTHMTTGFPGHDHSISKQQPGITQCTWWRNLVHCRLQSTSLEKPHIIIIIITQSRQHSDCGHSQGRHVTRLSICLSVTSPVRLSVCLSITSPICLSVCVTRLSVCRAAQLLSVIN